MKTANLCSNNRITMQEESCATHKEIVRRSYGHIHRKSPWKHPEKRYINAPGKKMKTIQVISKSSKGSKLSTAYIKKEVCGI